MYLCFLYQDFKTARAILRDLTVLPNGLMGGRKGGLAYLSNAILTDERCIILRESDSLFENFNQYRKDLGLGLFPHI